MTEDLEKILSLGLMACFLRGWHMCSRVTIRVAAERWQRPGKIKAPQQAMNQTQMLGRQREI